MKFLKGLCRIYHGESYTLENLDEASRAIAFRESIKRQHSLYEYIKEILNGQMPFHKEDIAIINRIVSPMGDMQPGSLPDTVIRSYGIHPWYIYNVKEQMDLLRVLVSGSGVVAIGEAGLDTLAESPMDLQKEVFLAQSQFSGGNT